MFDPVPDGEGWLHEDFHLADKDAVFAAARAGQRIGADDVVAASRVYTPAPIVEFLLQNTLGAIWLAMHPHSRLRSRWTRLVPDAVGPSTPPRPVADLRILDPCCGAGAFLVEAARMLTDLARDEAAMAGGRVSDGTARRLVAGCLWGGDLDAAAVGIARREIRSAVPGLSDQQIRVLPQPLGSFAPDCWPGHTWDVVVTNPPWIGARQLDPDLARAIGAAIGGARVSDLAVAMQARCWDLTGSGGRCGTVTPAGWLNDRGAATLRRGVLDAGGPRVVARLGQGVFDQAPLVFCAMTVLERGDPVEHWLVLGPDALGQSRPGAGAAPVLVSRSGVAAIASTPFAPAVPATVMIGTGARPTVGDHFRSFDGVWTGDNARDVRYWWELADPSAWARLSGGQGRAGWVSATRLRIDGGAVRDQPDRSSGIEYPRVAGGYLCARMADPETAALAGVVTLVPRDAEGAAARSAEVLALFNSRLGTAWLRTLSSGLNFNPGYAARVPLGVAPPDEEFDRAVGELCTLRAALLRRDPTHDGFAGVPDPWRPDTLPDAVRGVELQIDEKLRRHLAIDAAVWDVMAPAPSPRRAGSPLEDHLMERALRALGMRWPSERGTAGIEPMRLSHLGDRVADSLVDAHAPADVVDGARRWVARVFIAYQTARFRRRPVVDLDGGWVRPAGGR